MTHGSASPGSRPGLSSTAPSWPDDLGEFRVAVREWCREHVPAQWRRNQTGVPEAEFVVFQKEWFQRL